MWYSEPGIQCPAGGGQRLKALPQRPFYFRNLHGSNETFFFYSLKKHKNLFKLTFTRLPPKKTANRVLLTWLSIHGWMWRVIPIEPRRWQKPGTQGVIFLYLLFYSSRARLSPVRPTPSDPGSLTKGMKGRWQQRLLNLTSTTPRQGQERVENWKRSFLWGASQTHGHC